MTERIVLEPSDPAIGNALNDMRMQCPQGWAMLGAVLEKVVHDSSAPAPRKPDDREAWETANQVRAAIGLVKAEIARLVTEAEERETTQLDRKGVLNNAQEIQHRESGRRDGRSRA